MPGAGGDDGMVVERVGDRWNAYDAGDMSVRHVRFTEEWYGVEAHIVDEHYQMHHVTIHDSVTRLLVDSPPQLAGALEAGEFSYFGPDTLRAAFRLHDAENNHTQPTIALRTVHGDTNIAPQLNGEYVERCEDYSKGLMHHKFDLILTPDSVIFTAECFVQTFAYICSETCYPNSLDCRSSLKWTSGDTVLVAVDLDTLRIIHSNPSSARPEIYRNVSSSESSHVLNGLKRGIVDRSDLTRIEVFALDGRRIEVHEGDNAHLPGGTYVVRLDEPGSRTMIGRFVVKESGR